MAGADRADRVEEQSACQAENLPPSFGARCAEWNSAWESQPAEPDLISRLVRVLVTDPAVGEQP